MITKFYFAENHEAPSVQASKDSGLDLAMLFIILKAEADIYRGALPSSDQSEIKYVFFLFFRERRAKDFRPA